MDSIELGYRDNHSSFFMDKVVIELGCGTGLSSVVASKLGARYVYASDGNSEVVSLSGWNLKRNGILSDDGTSSRRYSNEEQPDRVSGGESLLLQWGYLNAVDYFDAADIIIGSDLT